MKKVELKKNVLSYIQDKHSKMFDKEKLRVTLSAKLAIYLLFILITFSIVIDITYQSHKQIHLKIFAAEKAAKKLEYSSQIRSGADSLIKSITKYIATDNDFYQHNYKNQYLKVKEIHKKLKNLDLSKEETSIIDSIEINNILFMMGDQRLSEETQTELLEKFEEHEEKVVGEGKHEKLHTLLEKLAKKYLD